MNNLNKFIIIILLIIICIGINYKFNILYNSVDKFEELDEYKEFDNFKKILKENNIDVNYFRYIISDVKIFSNNNYTLIKNNNIYDLLLQNINLKPFKIKDNFLTDDECDFIIETSKNNYVHSNIISYDNIESEDNDHRTSKTYFFQYKQNNIIENITKKIIKLLNINEDLLESLQSTKYDKNQFFKLHHDYLYNESNQRKYSIIIYLNDLLPEDGGETFFPFYNTKIIPKKGTILYFDNLFYNNFENPLTLHESKSILNNKSKYIITTWSRLNKYV